MSVIDDYLATLTGPEKEIIGHMYAVIREMVPDATEEMSYAMPAFRYKGKGFMAILQTKNSLSLYPFCSIERLDLDLSVYEGTKGSLHFSTQHLIPDSLLKQIIAARLNGIS